jgi:Glycosyl hydrolase family 26
MTAAPPGGPRLRRRGLLTLAALATLPAACGHQSPVEAAEAAPPAAAAPSPAAVQSLAPAATVTAAAPSASATPPAESAATTSKLGGPVPFRPGRARIGAYLSLSGTSFSQSLALRRRQLGRDYGIVHLFCAWNEHFERPPIGDSTLMISWTAVKYAMINNGSNDEVIAAAARNLAAQGKPTLLRWGWEMNGDWFDWDGTHNGQDTAGFIRAWRRMHGIFRAAGADNVAWVWSPNWNSGPNVGWNQMQRYYPGDAYVDWVGVSGYDFDSETPERLFTPVVSAYGGRKPIIISETASIDHGGASKANWTGDLAAYVRRTPQIGALCWFDTDTQSDSAHNFRIDSNGASLAAFRTMARSSRFAT